MEQEQGVRHDRENHAFSFLSILSSIIFPQQSYPLFVFGPKATDCIRGSRERKRGLFVLVLNSRTLTAHIKETRLLPNSLSLSRGLRAWGLT